jgi:hypothetical protein
MDPLTYRTIAVNDVELQVSVTGYGGSSKPPKVSDYSMDHLLADIAALIDASGRSDVTLFGHDWGAAQAWMSPSGGSGRCSTWSS